MCFIYVGAQRRWKGGARLIHITLLHCLDYLELINCCAFARWCIIALPLDCWFLCPHLSESDVPFLSSLPFLYSAPLACHIAARTYRLLYESFFFRRRALRHSRL